MNIYEPVTWAINRTPSTSLVPCRSATLLRPPRQCRDLRGASGRRHPRRHPVRGDHGFWKKLGGWSCKTLQHIATHCNHSEEPFLGTFLTISGEKKVEVFGGISWVHTDLLFFVNHRSPWSPWQLLGWSSPSSDESPALMGPWRLQTKPKTWWKALAAAGTPSGFHSSGRWMGLTWIINWQSQQKRLPVCELRNLDDSRCFIDAYCHTWMDIDI